MMVNLIQKNSKKDKKAIEDGEITMIMMVNGVGEELKNGKNGKNGKKLIKMKYKMENFLKVKKILDGEELKK